MGGKGGRVFRNIYKGQNQSGIGSRVGSGDGGGRGEWWEENGDNSTWTIKKDSKKKEWYIVANITLH